MLNVYLLRHGQTAWNAAGNKYCGRTDVPLTGLGISQAERARELLREIRFEKVYASPLERARRTAEIAANSTNGTPVETDQRLIEVDFGNWEGKTRAGFIRENPVCWENWCRDPGVTRAGETGETALEVVQRVDDFFNAALRRHSASLSLQPRGGPNDGGTPEDAGTPASGDTSVSGDTGGPNILVAGHNGINRLYLAWKLGMALKDYRRIVQENAAITLFSLDENGELTLKILNKN